MSKVGLETVRAVNGDPNAMADRLVAGLAGAQPKLAVLVADPLVDHRALNRAVRERLPGTRLSRCREEGMSFPVIVLTAKELSTAEEKHLQQGFAMVIQKGGAAIDRVTDQARQHVPQRRSIVTGRPRVLYVEDVEQNRDLVRRYLYPEFEVLEAEDGEIGVEEATLSGSLGRACADDARLGS